MGKKPHGTFLQNALTHWSKITPPDQWEVDPILNLINKIKYLEVPDYADIHY
jgi:hypothetical protein